MLILSFCTVSAFCYWSVWIVARPLNTFVNYSLSNPLFFYIYSLAFVADYFSPPPSLLTAEVYICMSSLSTLPILTQTQ